MIILKNLTSNNVAIFDLGEITVIANNQLAISEIYDLATLSTSVSLKQLINENKLIVNDGLRDLSKCDSILILSLEDKLGSYNPSDFIYMLQANLVQSIFRSNGENFYLENNLKNAKICFFNNQSQVSEINNIQFNGSSVGLSQTSEGIQKESFNSISNWSAVYSYDSHLTLETNIVHEGTGSAKFVIDNHVNSNKKRYIQRYYSSNQNFNTYSVFSLWIYGQGIGEEVSLILVDSNGCSYSTNNSFIKNGWQKIDFDISLIPRTSISKILISVMKHASNNELTLYFDDLRGILTTTQYNLSGSFISIMTETLTDVCCLYYNDQIDLPDNTNIDVNVSLDDGNHWHLLDENDRGKWLEIDQWTEQFDIKNKLKIKYDLSTTDPNVTCQVDDYILMWKLNI
jgi:hypothetical protein